MTTIYSGHLVYFSFFLNENSVHLKFKTFKALNKVDALFFFLQSIISICLFCWQVEGPYQQSGLRWSVAWCRCLAAWRPPRRTTSCWWRWSGLRRWCQISTPQSAIHREKTWNNTWIQFPAEEGPGNILCTGCELKICSQRNWGKKKGKRTRLG